MSIGFFDSGIGGLTILREVINVLPEYDYLYLADSKNVPYGEKSSQELYECAKRGLDYLFSKDAKLVILACNTASSQALRRIQQEWLPESKWADRKALGVLIPLAQEVGERSHGLVGVLATENTVRSGAYLRELRKVNPNMQIVQVAAPLLAPLIEDNASEKEIKDALVMYLSPLKLANAQSLILGCTHYPILLAEIREIMGDAVFIPNPGEVVAKKLAAYLAKHQEIEKKLDRNGKREFFTTGNAGKFRQLSARFFSTDIEAQAMAP